MGRVLVTRGAAEFAIVSITLSHIFQEAKQKPNNKRIPSAKDDHEEEVSLDTNQIFSQWLVETVAYGFSHKQHRKYDRNKDKHMDLEEFLRFMDYVDSSRTPLMTLYWRVKKPLFLPLYPEFDPQQLIDPADLGVLLLNLHEGLNSPLEESQAHIIICGAFLEFDTNHDRYLSFVEYVNFMWGYTKRLKVKMNKLNATILQG